MTEIPPPAPPRKWLGLFALAVNGLAWMWSVGVFIANASARYTDPTISVQSLSAALYFTLNVLVAYKYVTGADTRTAVGPARLLRLWMQAKEAELNRRIASLK